MHLICIKDTITVEGIKWEQICGAKLVGYGKRESRKKAHCDNCEKTVSVEFQQAGEYDSYICKNCGEVVLDD